MIINFLLQLLLSFSGGQTTKTFLASCECYNVLSNSWHHLNDLPEAMHGSGAAFLDGSLYLAGGKSQERYHSGLWVSTAVTKSVHLTLCIT